MLAARDRAGLKRAAAKSRRRKGTELAYHVNRGGRGLSRADRSRLEKAKRELRKAFGRPAEGGRRTARRAA